MTAVQQMLGVRDADSESLGTFVVEDKEVRPRHVLGKQLAVSSKIHPVTARVAIAVE